MGADTDPVRGTNIAYEQRLIERVRSVGRPLNVPRPGSWQVNRAIQTIDRTVDKFLRAVGLVRASHCSTGPYWAEGPSLLMVEAIPFGDAEP